MSVSEKIGPSSASWGSFIFVGITLLGFPDGASGKEPTCQWRRCQRHGFDPSVVKISWKKASQYASVLPENSHGQEEPGRLQCIGLQSQTRLTWLTMHSLLLADGEKKSCHYVWKIGEITVKGTEVSWTWKDYIQPKEKAKSLPLRLWFDRISSVRNKALLN